MIGNNYPTVTLNELQYGSGIYQAQMRDDESKRLGHSNARGLREDDGVSVIGSLGEIAAHVFGNLPFHYSVNEWGKPDLINRNNWSVDVKTSKTAHHLYVSPRHLHPDWYYLLVWQIDEYRYALVGYMRGDKVATFPTVDYDNRNSPVHSVPASALTKLKPLGMN
jgi:hypothetical protein